MQPVPIFTYLHAAVSKTIPGRVEPPDEGVCAVRFETPKEDYRVYIPEKSFQFAQCILFDGLILPDGLPSGSQTYDYEYGRKGEKYSTYGVKKLLSIERSASVSKSLKLASHQLAHDEREINLSRGVSMTSVKFVRNFLLLPKGHSALGFRVRPRSLVRQYTLIESTETNVIFRTLVK